jgi:hypothetical protein
METPQHLSTFHRPSLNMKATRAEAEPTYLGNVESILDGILLIESCLAGVRPFARPSPGGVHVESGQIHILRDIDGNAWEDGNSWLLTGPDNIGFLHSGWSNEDRLGKKTWAGDHQGHKFRLVAYYNHGEQPTQRPSWDRPLLTSIYRVISILMPSDYAAYFFIGGVLVFSLLAKA